MKPVDHLVLLRLKVGTTETQIKNLVNALVDLKNKVSGIVDIGAGMNVSPENLDKGHNFGYYARFEDAAARDAYLGSPPHRVVLEKYGSLIDDLTVVDFER